MKCWREWANEYSREVRGVTLQLPEALCTIQQCMCSWARDPWTARNKRALEAWAELRSCKGEASNTLNLVQPEAKTKTHRKKGIRSVAVPGSVSMQCTGLCLSDLQLFQAALDATLQHPPSNTATPSTSWQLQVLVPSQGISCWWQWPLQVVAMKAGGSAGSREGSSCPAAELTRGSLLTPPPGSQDIPKAASRGWVTAPHSHPGCSIMSSHRILPAEETNQIFCLLCRPELNKLEHNWCKQQRDFEEQRAELPGERQDFQGKYYLTFCLVCRMTALHSSWARSLICSVFSLHLWPNGKGKGRTWVTGQKSEWMWKVKKFRRDSTQAISGLYKVPMVIGPSLTLMCANPQSPRTQSSIHSCSY